MEIPQETAGPYPGDGSNGPNVLEASGVVRTDITASFGTSTTKAEGVPRTVTLTLLDNANGCKPLAGAAVYAWHCDREGKYSMYDAGLENENFLRGVQEADSNGQVIFSTIRTSDNVFGDDGGIYQLATMSGSVAAGYTAGLNVTV